MNRIIYVILILCFGWFLGGPAGALFMLFISLFSVFGDSHGRKDTHKETSYDFWEDVYRSYEEGRTGHSEYEQYRKRGYQYRPQTDNRLSEAYKTIGTNNNASNDEVRKAYRKACLRHHPDKFSTFAKEIQHTEEEKFKRLQDAYDVIKKERNIK